MADLNIQPSADTSSLDGKNGAEKPEASTSTPSLADRTYTQAELQSELDRIAAKTRNEEREKAKKAQDEAAKVAAEDKLKADGEWQKIAETAKAEADQLRTEVAKREHQALRTKVAASVFKDTARAEWVAARLVGETEAELLADAKESLKLFAQAAPPDDLGRNGGGKPDPAAVSDAQRERHAQVARQSF